MIPSNSNNNVSPKFYLPRCGTIRNALWSLFHRIATLSKKLFESIKKATGWAPSQDSRKEFKATPVGGNNKVDEAIRKMENSPIPPAPEPQPPFPNLPEPHPQLNVEPQPPLPNVPASALQIVLEPQPIAKYQEDPVRKRQELAARIAEERITLNDLDLSKAEMLELAPYLTYLSVHQIDYSKFKDEFLSELLEKTEQLSILKIWSLSGFECNVFSSFKNVEQLRFLRISCANFNSPLPEGMGALQVLKISSDNYNQPLPNGMGNLQKLILKFCKRYNQPLPSKLDALETLVIVSCGLESKAQNVPESMPALKTLDVDWEIREAFIPAISGIYKIDRERALNLLQIGMYEIHLLEHIFGSSICNLMYTKSTEALWHLLRREDIPFVHDAMLKDDHLQQSYIYKIYLKIEAASENLLEDTELFKKVLERFIRVPLDQNLGIFYQSLLKIEYSDLISLFKFININKEFEDLNQEKRLEFLPYLFLCSLDREVLLKNLMHMDKAGQLTAIKRIIPNNHELAETLSEKLYLFTGNCEEDRKSYLHLRAAKIAKDKTQILDLKLSEAELFELAPYLTYLDIRGISNYKLLTKCDRVEIYEGDRLDTFMCTLLEKTEHLKFLRIQDVKFDGSALARIKNIRILEGLEIINCPNFNGPLPADMDSLRSVVIQECNSFNQLLSFNVEQLDNLIVQRCNLLKSNSLLNWITPIFRNDEERGLKLATFLGFEAEFLQIYSNIWSEGNPPDSVTYYQTFASYIEDKKISIAELEKILTIDELLELAPHLTYLDIRGYLRFVAEGLIELSELIEKSVKVEHLCLHYISDLRNFKNIGNLQTLTITKSGRGKISLPEGMSKLRHLSISSTDFNDPLPNGMTSLESLHFFNCWKLNQRLPEDLTSLRELSFDLCRNYNQPIPHRMTKLESISILRCQSFNKDNLFPLFVHIYEVNQERCIGLANQLGLSDRLGFYMQFCESDDDATIATMLNFVMRSNLTLPPSALNKFETFMKRDADSRGRFVLSHRNDLLKHPQLREKLFSVYPPDEPDNFALFNTIKLENNILYLTLLSEAAFNFPDQLFKLIRPFLLGDEWIAKLNVRFHNNDGIDAGGLSRQLVTQFIQGLLNNSKMFKFEVQDNGKAIPQATTSLTDEDIINYAALGTFLGIAYRQKNPIGEVFSEKWFQCIFSLRDQAYEDIIQFLDQMDYTALKRFMENGVEHNEQNLKLYGTILTSEDEKEVIAATSALDEDFDDDNFHIEEIRNRVRKDWIAPHVIAYLQRAQAMVQGIKKALLVLNRKTGNSYWEDLSDMTPQKFSQRLQGTLSGDWIKSNLLFKPKNSPKVIEVKAWLEKWIDKHTDDYTSLANFVQTITGARTLRGPIKFKIRAGIDNVFVHTCSSLVEIPDNIEKNILKPILDEYGNGKDLSFNRS